MLCRVPVVCTTPTTDLTRTERTSVSTEVESDVESCVCSGLVYEKDRVIRFNPITRYREMSKGTIENGCKH